MALTRLIADLVRLPFGGKLTDAVNYAVPEMFLVPKDGKTSANAGLKAMFQSKYTSFKLTSGTYLLTDLLEIVFNKDVHVECEDGVVIKLGDNVRKHMMHFYGDYTHNFTWKGGEIDGNWEGQGGEVVKSGHVDDVSHGMVVSRWNFATITDIYAHDCMGHHFNHAGNNYFTAERIKVSSHTSPNFPLGGARGDGITGVSKHIYIRDVQGYSSDDLIGIFPGATWIPGETNPERLHVETVTVRDIVAESKTDENDVTRYTRHALTAGCWNNAHLRNIDVQSVKGEVQDGGVRIHTAPSSGIDPTLIGNIDNVSVRDIYCYVNGKGTDQYETVPVMIGSHQQSMSLKDRGIKYKNVHIDNVVCNTSGKVRTAIIVGHVNVECLNISNISVNFKDNTDTCSAVTLTGPSTIARVNLSNIMMNPAGGETDQVLNGRPIVRCSLGATTVTAIHGSNLTTRRNSNGTEWIGTVLYIAGFTNRVTLFGEDLIVNANDNFVAVNPAKGCHFTDRHLGRVRRDPKLNGWVFEDFCVVWDGNNFGCPNVSNFPGYSRVKDWAVGTRVKVTGSPLGECTEYVCTAGGATPKWSIASSQYEDGEGYITPTSLPTSLTPRMSITSLIFDVDGWPEKWGMLETYTGRATHSRDCAIQKFYSNSGNTVYIRGWNASTKQWNRWKKLVTVDMLEENATTLELL